MRLRFHEQVPTIGGSYSGYHGRSGAAQNGDDYAFVFENPPQRRTIFSGTAKSLWFPYIIWTIRYKKQASGMCWFGGVYYSGLCVSFSNKSLKSIDDQLLTSPTDYGGYVCTDHRFDNMLCNSPEEVAGTVLDIWWNSTHFTGLPGYGHPYMPNGLVWENLTEENVTEQAWVPSNYTLRTLLGIQGKKKLIDEAVGELPSRFFKVVR
jgi:hypothetical protein